MTYVRFSCSIIKCHEMIACIGRQNWFNPWVLPRGEKHSPLGIFLFVKHSHSYTHSLSSYHSPCINKVYGVFKTKWSIVVWTIC